MILYFPSWVPALCKSPYNGICDIDDLIYDIYNTVREHWVLFINEDSVFLVRWAIYFYVYLLAFCVTW